MENNSKTQVVERLKNAQNVLITVSNNPSVDQLSAAIGLTLMLNKLGKHATAVFSGQVPSTIEFLKPEETLEQNTDSLRDFIISLDKSKADKLRYKVEENVVKIFITPYRTSLSEQDFDFSQGDFNVDVVVALGVDEKDHIDQAIVANGRILHDATVIGVMAGEAPVDVGSINWQEPPASSLSEMIVSISESFQSGLLDGQMATAFLTGIVAETARFSNEKTTPKVMTMSAQLMAAGANQQLIATELLPEDDVVVPSDLPAPTSEVDVQDNQQSEGVLSLDHEEEQKPAPVKVPDPSIPEDRIHIDEQTGKFQNADDLAKAVKDVQNASRGESALAHEKVIQPLADDATEGPKVDNVNGYMTEPPERSGTLTASGQEDAPEPSTDPLSSDTSTLPPEQPTNMPEPNTSAVLATSEIQSPSLEADKTQASTQDLVASSEPTPSEQSQHPSSTLQADQQLPNADAARQAVLDAVNSAGFDANRPEPLQSVGAQPLGQELEHADYNPEEQKPPAVPPPILSQEFVLPDADGNLPPQNQN